MKKPIFYDPKQIRWKLFKILVFLVIFFISSTYSVLAFSVFKQDPLPSLNLHQPNRMKPQPTINTLTYPYQQTLSPLSSSSKKIKQIRAIYPNWQDNNFNSLKEHSNLIDVLMPEWLHLNATNLQYVSLDDPAQQKKVVNYIQRNQNNIKIIPILDNYNSTKNSFDDSLLIGILADPVKKEKLINNLFEYVQKNNFSGIHINFQDISKENEIYIKQFMVSLHQKFKSHNLEVSQTLPMDDSLDYSTFTTFNDFIIFPFYNEHSEWSKAGPISSIGWYIKNLDFISKKIPSEKLIIGLGSFGLDWKNNNPPQLISFSQVLKNAIEFDSKPIFDQSTFNPHFNFFDEKSSSHQIWFLNGITLYNQIRLAAGDKINSFALWPLGGEDPSVWEVLDKQSNFDNALVTKLQMLEYGVKVDVYGEGGVSKITQKPKIGHRSINYDTKYNLITDETIKTYPLPYLIETWGNKDEKKLVLTFDDGPDPVYTPKILDILKQKNIKATFFLIGSSSQLHPNLVKRILDEGHEVGNHSFTHPNITQITYPQLLFEINATQNLFESTYNLRSRLFRPPYGEERDQKHPLDIQIQEKISSLGYYTVGIEIDPLDWMKPGADIITFRTVEQVDQGKGNIILLHDGGGDRSQTVSALPNIIEQLQKNGYQFVTTSKLLGVDRSEILVASNHSKSLQSNINKIGFDIVYDLNQILKIFFYSTLILGGIRFIIFAIFAILQKLSIVKIKKIPNYHPFVSIIIPMFNEQKVITETINALLKSSYQNFEIIVIDDGSKDQSFAIVNNYFNSNPKVKLFRKSNSGKAETLNYGILKSKGEILITLDSDTIFKNKTIEFLIRHFANPKIGGVAGNAKVGNRINILTFLQANEYIVGQNLEKRALSILNSIYVIPGAVGAWRKKAVLQAGLFASDTLAEDTDLTVRLHKAGYKVIYEEKAVGLTESPENIQSLLKQRYRWTYGILQITKKNLNLLKSISTFKLSVVLILNTLFYLIINPIFAPLMDLLILGSLGWSIWQFTTHSFPFAWESVNQIVVYYAIFQLFDFAICVFAYSLELNENWTLLFWHPVQRFFYRQILYLAALRSLIVAIKGSIQVWNKLERTAAVTKVKVI